MGRRADSDDAQVRRPARVIPEKHISRNQCRSGKVGSAGLPDMKLQTPLTLMAAALRRLSFCHSRDALRRGNTRHGDRSHAKPHRRRAGRRGQRCRGDRRADYGRPGTFRFQRFSFVRELSTPRHRARLSDGDRGGRRFEHPAVAGAAIGFDSRRRIGDRRSRQPAGHQRERHHQRRDSRAQ